MIDIVPLARHHSRAVANLHLRFLSTPHRGVPGRRLLETYYQTVSLGRGATGYVAEQAGAPRGYVCGVWDPSALRSMLLRSQWLALALWGAASVASQPLVARSFLHKLSSRRDRDSSPALSGYELRPIVVDEPARGSGLALRLFGRLSDDARGRGFDRLHLFVEDCNAAAVAFYLKIGLAPVKRVRHDGVQMTLFECRLTHPT